MNNREKKSLALLVVSVLVFGFYQYVIDPFLNQQQEIVERAEAEKEELEQISLSFKKAQNLKLKAPLLRNRIDRFTKKLLPGGKPPVAAAELQRMLKQMAGRYEVKIIRERIIEPLEKGGYLQISVQVTFNGTATKLAKILYDIEYHQLFFLMVSKLRIRINNTRAPKKIETTIEVSGFINPLSS